MTPQEKANEIIKNFGGYVHGYVGNIEYPDILKTRQKEISKNVVNTIIEALIEYGQDNMELQNMDSEIRYWNHVKEVIENY